MKDPIYELPKHPGPHRQLSYYNQQSYHYADTGEPIVDINGRPIINPIPANAALGADGNPELSLIDPTANTAARKAEAHKIYNKDRTGMLSDHQEGIHDWYKALAIDKFVVAPAGHHIFEEAIANRSPGQLYEAIRNLRPTTTDTDAAVNLRDKAELLRVW